MLLAAACRTLPPSDYTRPLSDRIAFVGRVQTVEVLGEEMQPQMNCLSASWEGIGGLSAVAFDVLIAVREPGD